ncbi:MAG: IPExxxVDY family protein [Flavobacteriaceae bacterium]
MFKLESAKEDTYKLIAIHSNLKIYSLAFQINKYCYTNFIRSKNDILIDGTYKVPCFEWKINEKGIDFELFENKYMIEGNESSLKDSLFSFSSSKELSLIESHKEVDFFIKQNCYFSTLNLIEKMSKIPHISFTYILSEEQTFENFNFEI